jgi:hypothetical protein
MSDYVIHAKGISTERIINLIYRQKNVNNGHGKSVLLIGSGSVPHVFGPTGSEFVPIIICTGPDPSIIKQKY